MWQKADDMEHEIKVKADDRWMDDSEVSHCLGCKTEFSFLLRKVCVVNSHFVFFSEDQWPSGHYARIEGFEFRPSRAPSVVVISK